MATKGAVSRMKQHAQREAARRERDAEIPRLGAQAVLRRDDARGKRGRRDGEVSGGLVEPEREAAAARADEVDLHVHGHRPRESLVQAEQRVRGDHPAPRRREDDDERHRQADEPAGDQDRPAREALREASGEEIREGLRQPERRDERDRDGLRGDAELVPREHRQDRPLQPDHAADERVGRDEQRELLPVRAEAERWSGARRCRLRSAVERPVASLMRVARSARPNSAR